MPPVRKSPPGHRIAINLGERSYSIDVGAGLLGEDATWSAMPAAASALIVTNDVVAPLYGGRVADVLRARYSKVTKKLIIGAERWRTQDSVEYIHRK